MLVPVLLEHVCHLYMVEQVVGGIKDFLPKRELVEPRHLVYVHRNGLDQLIRIFINT